MSCVHTGWNSFAHQPWALWNCARRSWRDIHIVQWEPQCFMKHETKCLWMKFVSCEIFVARNTVWVKLSCAFTHMKHNFVKYFMFHRRKISCVNRPLVNNRRRARKDRKITVGATNDHMMTSRPLSLIPSPSYFARIFMDRAITTATLPPRRNFLVCNAHNHFKAGVWSSIINIKLLLVPTVVCFDTKKSHKNCILR